MLDLTASDSPRVEVAAAGDHHPNSPLLAAATFAAKSVRS